jgi:hypothetical protein
MTEDNGLMTARPISISSVESISHENISLFQFTAVLFPN